MTVLQAYVHEPLLFGAMEWTDLESARAIVEWINASSGDVTACLFGEAPTAYQKTMMQIKNKDGYSYAREGFFIVHDIDGRFVPMEKEFFHFKFRTQEESNANLERFVESVSIATRMEEAAKEVSQAFDSMFYEVMVYGGPSDATRIIDFVLESGGTATYYCQHDEFCELSDDRHLIRIHTEGFAHFDVHPGGGIIWTFEDRFFGFAATEFKLKKEPNVAAG